MGRLLTQQKYDFETQFVLGNYIVDFYIKSAKLVVEVDGGYHLTGAQVDKDIRRERMLLRQNKVKNIVRFTNEQVFGDPALVLQRLSVYTRCDVPATGKRRRKLERKKHKKLKKAVGHPHGRRVGGVYKTGPRSGFVPPPNVPVVEVHDTSGRLVAYDDSAWRPQWLETSDASIVRPVNWQRRS